MNAWGLIGVSLRTTEDPLLVREDANVLSKRLSEGYGHLICFPVLMEDTFNEVKQKKWWKLHNYNRHHVKLEILHVEKLNMPELIRENRCSVWALNY